MATGVFELDHVSDDRGIELVVVNEVLVWFGFAWIGAYG